MCQVFRENQRRKAPGPNSVSPACLKTCADQSPHASNAPPSSPSKRNPKLLNDYKPVALTSVFMKSFEILVLAYLKASTGPGSCSFWTYQGLM